MDLIQDSYISFVNLEHRTDRLEHMNAQLARVDISATRTRGLLPVECLDKKGIEVMMKRTPGAVGCHFSQVSIMQKALQLGKHAWVMEDDLIFCNDFRDRIEYIEKYLQGVEWDVMWLGGTFHSPAFWHRKGRSGMDPDCSAQLGKDFDHTDDPRIKRTYGEFCTYAYIVNHSSIEKILNLFDEHLHTSIGIDWLFIKLQPQLKCFAFVPGSVKQMDNKSDIGNGITKFSGFAMLNRKEECNRFCKMAQGKLINDRDNPGDFCECFKQSRYWYQENMNDFNPNTFQWK